ncbi:hypothetical protein D9M72_551480 [compost metagenome]
MTVGVNSDHTALTRSLMARLCLLASRKRVTSRFSCAKALTTRIPGMVSASTLVISDQMRSIFSKPCRRRSRTRWIIQAMNGSGTSVTSASQGLIETRITAVMTIISTSVAKSSRCRDRNTQMRSLSEPMRAIRSPVRLPPKYSSDSLSRCSYVVVRRSAPKRSDTRASK